MKILRKKERMKERKILRKSSERKKERKKENKILRKS